MRAYVGVDWSASEIVCATATDNQEPRKIKSARREFSSVRSLLNRVRSRHPDADEVHVFIEAGARGWVQMLHYAGAVVHVVDSKQAKKFGESLSSSRAKSDESDSVNLTWLGLERCDRLEVWEPGSQLGQELAELASLHETSTKDRTASIQRLMSYLRERFPTLETALSSVNRKWAISLLQAVPTPFHASQLTRDDFDELMDGSGTRHTTREKVWTALERTEAPWLTEDMAAHQAFVVRCMLDEVVRRQERVEEIEAKLDAATEQLSERPLLESVDGIAMKMANRLIECVFGDRLPDNRDEASIKLGAAPVFRGSGKKKNGRPKGIVKMRRSANSRARATAYLLGRLASQRLGWAKARYAYDKARNKSSAHSYRIIARSLLRILTAMLKNDEPYDDARYIAALKANGVPWAMSL